MPSEPGTLRIIGGQWRRRSIRFDATANIRPTPDRIRETLFNWLQQTVSEATCLDCFAGSGALGFEALSRGAAHVMFLDSDHGCLAAIQKNAERLGTTTFSTAQTIVPDNTPALSFSHFKLAFVDPPFRQGLLLPCLTWLHKHGYVDANSVVYIECEKDLELSVLDKDWKILKLKHTKAFQYGLISPKTQ